MTRSWRVCYWVEVEVSADTIDEARAKASDTVYGGSFDPDQMTLDDIWEVDPLMGVASEGRKSEGTE